MTPAQATVLLQNDPETLLRKASVRIFGDNVTASGRHHFIIDVGGATVPGFTTGLSGLVGKTKARPVVEIRLRRAAFPAQVAAATPATTVFAQYIAMRQTTDGIGATHRVLPAAGGPDLMLTGQLSGCSFGIGSDAAGARLVSHIQPNDAVAAGPARVADLGMAINAGFAGAPDTVFGRGAGYGAQAAIIGIRRGGAWEIFGQTREMVPIDAINLEMQIASVRRLL